MVKKILLFVFFLTGIFVFVNELNPPPSRGHSPLRRGEGPPEIITVALVGDVMLDRGVDLKIKTEGENDFNFPFLKIGEELRKADIVFGNLENPISDKGEKVGSIYSFRADPKTIESLTFAGFDILSMANNHALDYGRLALEDTYERLEKAGIEYTGGGMNESEAVSPVIKEIKETKIGFLAYTNLCSQSWRPTETKSGISCISENNLENVKEEIKAAKEKVDILIVSLHAGEEYTQKITAFQANFARSAIDAGADIIAGHHPHVVQKSEKYKDGYIFYSLGNFVFDQSFSKETMQGQMAKILIENKKIKEIELIDININENFQPARQASQIAGVAGGPETTLSSTNLKQGDTLLIKINEAPDIGEIKGTFGTEKINFFKTEALNEAAAILGVDAKKTPGSYNLTIDFPNGSQFKKTITVAKTNFPITELAVTKELEEKGYTQENIAENIAKNDGPILREALIKFTPQSYFTKPFIYPLKTIKNVGAFGNIRKSGDISLQHLGVDLDAETGTKVFAANDGVVTLTYDFIDYGKTMVVDHGLGIFSLYLHMDKFNFKEGQKVKQGDIIGLSGNTGYSIAPHLHFSVKLNGSSVDPLRLIELTKQLDK